jgi:4-amino-4-deoxy-L-arabinose transferase-like glycosyltransferase
MRSLILLTALKRLGFQVLTHLYFNNALENSTISNERLDTPLKASGRELLSVLGLAMLGCILRIALIPYGDFISSDGVYYATLGRNLLAGDLHHGISAYWSPLYPLLIALFTGVFRDPALAGRLVSALAGGILVVPVYFLSKRFSHRRLTAVVAALFVIFEPRLLYYSLRVLTEPVYILLLITGILIGWIALERGLARYFFLTGLVFGLAYLTRPEALGYVLLLCLIVGVVGFARKAGSWWMVSRASLVVLGALLAAAPYVYYLRQETGRWMLTEKFAANMPGSALGGRKLLPDGQLTLADILWAGTRPERAGSEIDIAPTSGRQDSQSPGPSLLRRLAEHTTRTLKGLYQEYLMINEILPALLIGLIGIGLFARKWSTSRIRLELYVGSFIFATFLGYAFTFHNHRYLVPLIPLALCWAASGAVVAASWLHDTFASRAQDVLPINSTFGHAIAVVTVVVILSQSVTIFTQLRKNDSGGQRKAAEWIRSQGLQSPLIMATGPWPAYYAGGRHLYIPSEELPVVLAYAKRKKVDFIVLEDRWLETTPSLAPLLTAKTIPPELTLVYERVTDRQDHGFRVFRVSQGEDRSAMADHAGERVDLVPSLITKKSNDDDRGR